MLGENVEWDATHTLVDILGSIDVDITGTIQDQISQLFNEKVSATQLQNYVASQLSEDVSSWLNTNVNPVGSAVVVDSSLTISGAAADAKIVGDNISDLKSAIYNESFLNFTDDKWINNAGIIYDSNLWALSNAIPVVAGYKLRIKTDIQVNASICILNSNGVLITSIQGTSGIKNYDITVPDGGTQILFSCYKFSKTQASVTPLYLSDSVVGALKTGSSIVTANVKSDNVITGYLITKSGFIAESASWDVSGFISVPSCDSIIVNAYMYGNGAVVFYNANKEVVLGIDGNNASEYGGGNRSSRSQIITISDANNIRFVRFCTQRAYVPITGLYVSYSAKWVDYANDLITNSNKGVTYENKKVLVIGDSISTDAYGSYKKWVTNLIEGGKLSLSNTTNSSQHATGFVARYNNQPNDFISRMEAITDKSSYDLVIVFGGINDYIQNIPLGESGQDKTVYFKPAVDYFFQYLVNNFTQARICVLLPLRTYNIWPNTAGNKQEVYSEYIHDVAKYYCLPVLNLTEESGFCPFIDSFKIKWTLIPSGYTDPDGVHPNAQYEKEYLAPMIWKFISGLIN